MLGERTVRVVVGAGSLPIMRASRRRHVEAVLTAACRAASLAARHAATAAAMAAAMAAAAAAMSAAVSSPEVVGPQRTAP